MTFRIVSADPRSVEIALDCVIDLPAVAVIGLDDGHPVGSGGLAWGGGKAWIWFKMVQSKPSYAVAIVRATRKMLRRAAQLGETAVFTPRDINEPMSEKLLTMLGFEFFDVQPTAEGGQAEIWVWHG